MLLFEWNGLRSGLMILAHGPSSGERTRTEEHLSGEATGD